METATPAVAAAAVMQSVALSPHQVSKCPQRPWGRSSPEKLSNIANTTRQVTVINGQPSPTCRAGESGCGKLCTGYWCSPTPTGSPPGYSEPGPTETTGPGKPEPPPGTQCSKDGDCDRYGCPDGQHTGCVKSSPFANSVCWCLEDEKQKPEPPPGTTCSEDYDCYQYGCTDGKHIGCVRRSRVGLGACWCLDPKPEPPAGTKCKKDSDCSQYGCPNGGTIGCVKSSPFADSVCWCNGS